jgi:hypothetical protein
MNHWCELDELIHISQTDEEYKQYAGLNYNENMMEQLAQMKIRNSSMFIDFFSHPRSLFLDCFLESTILQMQLKSICRIGHIKWIGLV